MSSRLASIHVKHLGSRLGLCSCGRVGRKVKQDLIDVLALVSSCPKTCDNTEFALGCNMRQSDVDRL